MLRRLYPLCREAGFDITVTLVHREQDWVLTDVEAGDQTRQHYALAVDYGSTNIVMQLVDMESSCVIGEEKAPNGQIAYGTDILTRITFAMEGGRDKLQRSTVDTFHRLLAALTESTGIDAAGCPVMVVSGTALICAALVFVAVTSS